MTLENPFERVATVTGEQAGWQTETTVRESGDPAVVDMVEAELADAEAEIDDDGDEDYEDSDYDPEADEDTPKPFTVEEDWPHDIIEWNGLRFGVRLPSQQALTGFTMATGAYVPEAMRQNMAAVFMFNHFSPQSYHYLMTQMMNPDNEILDSGSFDKIIELLVTTAGEKILADLKAKQAALDAAASKPPKLRARPNRRK
jgi:hypothetical protein